MKVAIVGAGLAGLSCAFELKKYGIIPTIFERRSQVGDSLDYAVCNFRMFTSFYDSPQRYFKRNYGLDIKPIKKLKKTIMISPNTNTIVKGKLGYLFKRGLEPYSMENQIARQVGLPIVFDTHINIDDIRKDFDYVVWATGSNQLSRKLDVWTSAFNTHIRIATIVGDFKTNSSIIWFNTNYTRSGFAYLLPYDKSKANLTLIVNNISPSELNYYWREFLTREKLHCKIIETRDVEYVTGFVSPLKIDNIFLTGNAAGVTGSLLGNGTINAIESGIMAGRSIAKELDYDMLMKKTLDSIKLSYELRKFINTFDNRDFDKLISFLGLPIVKQLVYKNPFYKVSHTAKIMRLYNNFIGN